MWVKFTDTFWYHPKPQVKTRYRSGTVINVPAACGSAAIDAGKAVKMKKPSKTAKPVEADDGV